jgi:putative membrane protein
MKQFLFILSASQFLLTAAESVPASDLAFAKRAAQSALAEIRLSQLALTESSSQAVKDFAQRMVDDHTRIDDNLRAVAGREDIMLPSDLAATDQTVSDHLSGLSGDAFDKAYMSAMLKDARGDIEDFQKEVNSGSDKDLRGFASTALPTLRQHLQLADSTAVSVGAVAASAPNL